MVAEDQVSALLASKIEAVLQHLIDHVLVADVRANDLSPGLSHRVDQSGVAHDRRDQGLLVERSLLHHVQRRDRHDIVAVDQIAVFVAQQHAIGVAIMGQSDIGAVLAHLGKQLFRMHRPAILVDVLAVGLIAHDEDLGAELLEHAGGGFVGGAVRAIDHDPHAFQRHAAGKGGLSVFDITPQRVIDAHRLANRVGGRTNVLNLAAEDQILDVLFDAFGQLVTVGPEEFDAVIVVGIV